MGFDSNVIFDEISDHDLRGKDDKAIIRLLVEKISDMATKLNRFKGDVGDSAVGAQTNIVGAGAGSSGGGGSPGATVQVEKDSGFALSAGDNTIAFATAFSDADYGLQIQCYKEDPTGERNGVAFTLKSWDKNGFVINVPEACELWYSAIE